MLTSRRLKAGLEDDAGSVMIALIVIMVVAVSMVVTIGLLDGGLNLARNDQNRTNAFQFANAGMDQALQRIDSKVLPALADGDYAPILNGSGQVIGFRDKVVIGSAPFESVFEIEARQDPVGQDTVWKVWSTGLDNPSGRQRQAIATVTATPLFVNAFFTTSNFYLTGNQTSPVAYDSSVCPEALVSCELNPVPARLGTNASFDGANETIEAFKARWEAFNMYGRATQSTADYACAQYRCGTSPKVIAHTNQLDPLELMPDASTFTDGCPSGGNISGGALSPGNYRCPNLTLSGTVSVVEPSDPAAQKSVKFYVDGTFSAGPGTVVNQKKPTPWFQVYQPMPGDGSICGAELWALLFTPGLKIECSGSHQPAIYGSVVAEVHGGTGNQFDFHWDMQARTAVHNGKYVIKNWRECPPGTNDC